MFLKYLLLIPFCSGVFSILLGLCNLNFSKIICLLGMLLTLFFCLFFYGIEHINLISQNSIHSLFHYEFSTPWIHQFGINFSIGIDGLSCLMIILTCILSIISILSMWNYNNSNQDHFFYFNFMLMISNIIGIFIALDVFLFFIFWELSSIPIYFFIIHYGKPTINRNIRIFTANQFLIYMQISGLLLLLGILGLVVNFYRLNHFYTFEYAVLRNSFFSNIYLEYFIMLLFFLSFMVKLPIFPFQKWLIDAHKHAPITGFLDITGILLKTSIYGLLRFNIFFFPYCSFKISTFIFFLGIVSIIYNTFMAIVSKNIKEILTYASLSHIGLMLISIYNPISFAYQGMIIQLFSSTISIAALFLIISQLYRRLYTYDIYKLGGLWSELPWISFFSLFFIFANLNIPGTGNFVGECMALLGLINNHIIITIIVTINMFFCSVYSIRLFQSVFYGEIKRVSLIKKCDFYEILSLLILFILLICIGIFPNCILNITSHAMNNIYYSFSMIALN